MDLLVLGIGNLLLSDDGLGVHAAMALMKEKWPDNVAVMEAGTFTQDVFYLFENYSTVLILDILHASGKPGNIYRLTEKELTQNTSQRMSIHDIDLLDSLNMAELLYKKRPKLHILGMEPADYTTWSMEITPELQKHFPAFLEEARKTIMTLSKELTSL